MMLYIYTLLIPILIVLIKYFFTKPKPVSKVQYFNTMVGATPYLYIYAFILYLLEIKGYINEGWVFYSFIFFLIPVTLLLVAIRNYFRNKFSNTENRKEQ